MSRVTLPIGHLDIVLDDQELTFRIRARGNSGPACIASGVIDDDLAPQLRQVATKANKIWKNHVQD